MFAGLNSKSIETIIILNALVFIIAQGSPGFVRDYLAVTPANIFTMPWTIVTNMFAHISFSHILMNMLFGVFMFGSYLENIIGAKNFLKTYFLGGLFATMFYIVFSLFLGIPNPLTPALGASGAVFSIIGALVILRPNMVIRLYFFIPMKLWMFAGLFMIYSITSIPAGGGIAHTAHIGGIIYGIMMGKTLKKPELPSYTYIKYM